MSSLCTPPPPGAERIEGPGAAQRAALLLDTCGHTGGPLIEALDLSENRLGVEGATILCRSLSGRSVLSYLSLFSCGLTDAGCELVAHALSGEVLDGSSLRKLNLQCNGLTDVSCVALAAMLQTPRGQALTTLYLGENHFGPCGMRILCEAIRTSPKFASLELAGNELTRKKPAEKEHPGGVDECYADVSAGASADASNNIAVAREVALILGAGMHLEQLNLSGNALGDEGVQALAKAIEDSGASCILRSLNLYDNCIGSIGSAMLSRALGVNSSLRHLNLMHNPLGDEGAECIAAALEGHRSSAIQDLNLCHCSVGYFGAIAFIPVMSSSRELRLLDLDDNPFCLENNNLDLIKKMRVAWMSGPMPRSRFGLKTDTSWVQALHQQVVALA